MLVLVDRGQIDLDAPVAQCWPGFAAAGKAAVTVRQVLSHQAGLIALRERQPVDLLYDWDATCAALAAEAPWFAPGTAIGEQALFYGHLCGELVRRVDGRSLGRFWREAIAGPWALDIHIGLRAAERARAVDLTGGFPHTDSELFALATSNPAGLLDLEVVNGQEWRSAEIPGGQRSRHRDRRRTLLPRPPAWRLARRHPSALADACPGDGRRRADRRRRPPRFRMHLGPGLHAWARGDGFGMGGIGGSLGWADPDLELAEAYITRQMASHARAEALDAAVRAFLLTG